MKPKQCPFCGGEPNYIETDPRNDIFGYIACDNEDCPANPDIVCDAGSELEHWNTRPEEDRLRQENRELREKNENQAGMIYRLDSRIAEFEARERLVPVSERLPSTDGLYLVVLEYGLLRIISFDLDIDTKIIGRGGSWTSVIMWQGPLQPPLEVRDE